MTALEITILAWIASTLAGFAIVTLAIFIIKKLTTLKKIVTREWLIKNRTYLLLLFIQVLLAVLNGEELIFNVMANKSLLSAINGLGLGASLMGIFNIMMMKRHHDIMDSVFKHWDEAIDFAIQLVDENGKLRAELLSRKATSEKTN